MSDAVDPKAEFDRDAFENTSDGLISLYSRLPGDAVEVLAREVVLRLAYRAAGSPLDRMPSEAEIARLCDALISSDRTAAAEMITDVRATGVSVETIYLSYLAVAARRLGEGWESDRLSFAEVTVGTSRIYAIMLGLRRSFRPVTPKRHRLAAFASVPGEDHTLGVTMAADLFRKAGWEIDLKVGLSHDELIDQIGHAGYPVIGLSAGGEKSLAALIRLVLALRLSAPQTYIMISGHIVEEEPEIVRLTGADGSASDVRSAQNEMRRLLDLSQFDN